MLVYILQYQYCLYINIYTTDGQASSTQWDGGFMDSNHGLDMSEASVVFSAPSQQCLKLAITTSFHIVSSSFFTKHDHSSLNNHKQMSATRDKHKLTV
jgi:hypothetical protein